MFSPCCYGVCRANNGKSVDFGYSYMDVNSFLGVAKKRLDFERTQNLKI